MGLHDRIQRLSLNVLSTTTENPRDESLLNQWRWRASLLLMFASGFAGLGYQIVWTQQCALWLGHESAGVLAVVTAFFGGLAVGALTFGPRIENSMRPARWYAGCELLIASWSLLLALMMSPFSTWLLDLTGIQPTPVWQWTVAFFGTFFVLLPATAAMGATLPAMERVTAQLRTEARSIAPLYASNTFGAVIGVLAIAFWLVPEFGLVRTALVCVVLNVLCGVMSLSLLARTTRSALSLRYLHECVTDIKRLHHSVRPELVEGFLKSECFEGRRSSLLDKLSTNGKNPEFHTDSQQLVATKCVDNLQASTQVMRDKPAARGVLIRLALTGLLGIGYEVLVVRVLSQVAEDTVYTFAMLLAVYLVGSAAGAATYARAVKTRGVSRVDNGKLNDQLFCALAVACLIGTASLWFAEQIKATALAGLGASMSAALTAEALLALVAFGPPTFVMGALFSHLSASANVSGVSFGRALGVNTLGAAAAPLLFGVLAFPALGPKFALLLICCGYLALSAWRTWLTPLFWLPASAVLVAAFWAPPLAFIEVPDGGHIVSYQEGIMAAVSVVEDADGVARLRIDNRQQEGSSSTLRVDARQALLPLLLHPAPKHALFLGLGTGITASSAAQYPDMQVDAVELLPEVIKASTHFTQIFTDNAQLHLMAADARRYVRVSKQRYDVIVSDNFHPARSGSGSLYTVEHFAAVRDRLASHGIFCQWLPLHQLDLETLRSIVQSFMSVYPSGSAMLASNSLETPVLGLIGRRDDERFDIDVLREHLTSVKLPQRLSTIGIEDEFALLGSFVAGPKALQRFAGNAALNTDDHPVVTYRAPRITYAPSSLPRDRLSVLLHDFYIKPDEVINDTDDSVRSQRLAAYWLARDRFIAVGLSVRPSFNAQDMLAQVREPLLSVLHISPDFRPAYDPLISMAITLAQTDRHTAQALLAELAHIQPARLEAGLALRTMTLDTKTISAP